MPGGLSSQYFLRGTMGLNTVDFKRYCVNQVESGTGTGALGRTTCDDPRSALVEQLVVGQFVSKSFFP